MRVVLIYVVYPLCRYLFSCIFLIPVKIPVKSDSGKIHSKVSGTGAKVLMENHLQFGFNKKKTWKKISRAAYTPLIAYKLLKIFFKGKCSFICVPSVSF